MKKIKAVIFDLDGTIANTIPLCLEAFRKSIEPLISKSISDKEITDTFGPSEEGTIMTLAPNNYEQGILDYLYFYEHLHEMCPMPFEGIIELLEKLKASHIRLAMVTGKGNKSTEISLQKFGITHFFEKIETGHSIGARKPEGLKAVLDFLDEIHKDEIIYIGDAPSDIDACRKVGISIVAAAWANTAEPERLMDLMPDQLFYNISDFNDWISSKI